MDPMLGRRGWAGIFQCSAALGLLACSDIVDPVMLPDLAGGPAFLAFVSASGGVEIAPFGPDDELRRLKDSSEQVFLLTMSPARVRSVYPRVELSRLSEARIQAESPALDGCQVPGLVREGPEETSIELELAPVAMGYELLEGRFEPRPLLPEFEALSLEVPLAARCQSRRYEMHPFGAKSPVIGSGDVVNSTTITRELSQVFSDRGAAYLGRDAVVVANGRYVYVLSRSGTIEQSAVWDVADLTPAPANPAWTRHIEAFELAERTAPGRGVGLVLVSILESTGGVEPIAREQRIFELELSLEQIRVTRTRYDDRTGRPLRRVRARPPDSFVAVGFGIVVYEREGETRVLETQAAGLNLTDALYLGPEPPEYAFATTTGSWLVGTPTESTASLVAEPSVDVSRPAAGHRLASLGSETERRLFGSTSLPAVLQRGSDGWRPIPLWLPPDALGCASGIKTCGRASLGAAGARALVSVPPSRLAFAFAECPGAILFDPARDECAAAVVGPLQNWVEGDWTAPTTIATFEELLLLSGDGGLLVETSLEVAP